MFHCEAWDRATFVGISLDQARVHRKAFTADEAGRDTGSYHALKHATENIMIVKTFVACTREHRVVWDFVLNP